MNGESRPPDDLSSRSRKAAAAHLWSLLRASGPHRGIWVSVAIQRGLTVIDNEVCEEAVRRVLVDHLWDCGLLGRKHDPENLKNQRKRPWLRQVHDVANQRRLSTRTLRVFIEAFQIDQAKADRLWAIHSGALPPETEVAPE